MTEEEKQEIEEEIPDDTPDSNFSKIDNGSYNLPVIEIYKNDFENYEPYVPNSGETEEKEDEEKEEEEKKEEEEETEEKEEDTDETKEKPFDWQLGEILETYYYNKFSSIDYEQDYTEISSSASIIHSGISTSEFLTACSIILFSFSRLMRAFKLSSRCFLISSR